MSEIDGKKIIRSVESITDAQYVVLAEAILLMYRYMESIEERVEKLERKEVM